MCTILQEAFQLVYTEATMEHFSESIAQGERGRDSTLVSAPISPIRKQIVQSKIDVLHYATTFEFIIHTKMRKRAYKYDSIYRWQWGVCACWGVGSRVHEKGKSSALVVAHLTAFFKRNISRDISTHMQLDTIISDAVAKTNTKHMVQFTWDLHTQILCIHIATHTTGFQGTGGICTLTQEIQGQPTCRRVSAQAMWTLWRKEEIPDSRWSNFCMVSINIQYNMLQTTRVATNL